jgi:flagellar hook-associated protein 2
MATTVSSSSSSAVFTASGLASGMDTASIVDKLVQLESAPITLMQTRQTSLRTQLSTVGSIVSKLGALHDAASALAANGVLAVTSASTNASFTATPSSGANAGRYSVQVLGLARAAQARSAAFSSGAAPVQGGTLDLTVQGTDYAIPIADGTALSDVAAAIRASGAPITATVLSDGTSSYLSLTDRDTGYPVAGQPGDALAFSFTPAAGATGQALGLASTATAENARISLDGLTLTRQSNTISDAIPGTTLTLQSLGDPEDVVLASDPAATKANLQGFVDAYNGVMQLLHQQLAPSPDADRSTLLVGDSTVRGLQGQLQRLTSTMVSGLGSVRTLADLGIKTAQDGTLSIDENTLTAAISRDPQAVNQIFSTASTGIGDVVGALVDQGVQTGTGSLTIDQKRISDSISDLDDQIATTQRRVDAYRQALVAQFTAMEQTVSSLKSISAYLTSQSTTSASSK